MRRGAWRGDKHHGSRRRVCRMRGCLRTRRQRRLIFGGNRGSRGWGDARLETDFTLIVAETEEGEIHEVDRVP